LNVVDRILRLPELEAAPPVLVDVGAAQGTHPRWRRMARYAVCVAFEADERELRSVTREAAGSDLLATWHPGRVRDVRTDCGGGSTVPGSLTEVVDHVNVWPAVARLVRN
jgi:hypothetical protein